MLGIKNFRDFGGFPSSCGGRVVSGALYRSGHLANATEADLDQLARLKLSLVLDLRRPAEQAAQPSRWPDTFTATRIAGTVDEEKTTPRKFSVASAQQRLTQFYQRILYDLEQRQLARQYFHWLSANKGNVLIHCAAGKDRTGVVAALTLLLLGVHRDDIIADFLKSNDEAGDLQYISKMRESLRHTYGTNLSDEVIITLKQVKPELLVSMLNILDEDFGGVERFFIDTLELRPGELQVIREKLLC